MSYTTFVRELIDRAQYRHAPQPPTVIDTALHKLSWADGKDRDMWPGRCTATIQHRWVSAGGQGTSWVFGRAANDTEWLSREETVRCMRGDGHRGRHMYREPPVSGFPNDERHHEWSGD